MVACSDVRNDGEALGPALAERKLWSLWVVLVYNRQILVQVGDGAGSPQ